MKTWIKRLAPLLFGLSPTCCSLILLSAQQSQAEPSYFQSNQKRMQDSAPSPSRKYELHSFVPPQNKNTNSERTRCPHRERAWGDRSAQEERRVPPSNREQKNLSHKSWEEVADGFGEED